MIVQRTGWCAYTGSIFALTVFLFINTIMFLLLLKPEIYYAIKKYRNNSVDKASKARYQQILADYMVSEKPYLDPEISIEKVAKEISINTWVLSQIINDSFHCNFNVYINNFRLKECLKHFSEANNKKTVLEILYESGFNSKSVFYAEFKKHTGVTPQEFRTNRTGKRT